MHVLFYLQVLTCFLLPQQDYQHPTTQGNLICCAKEFCLDKRNINRFYFVQIDHSLPLIIAFHHDLKLT